jgi:hypothetical protein
MCNFHTYNFGVKITLIENEFQNYCYVVQHDFGIRV